MATCPQCRTKYSDAMRACPRDGAALVADAFFSSATSAGAASLQPAHGIGPGSMIGDYRVEAQIGAGTFGTVYRVVQPVIGKRAAIKVLNQEFCDDPIWVSRFVDEVFEEDKVIYRKVMGVLRSHDVDEREIRDAAASRIKNQKEGTVAYEEAMRLAMRDERKRRGLVTEREKNRDEG